MSKHVNPQCKGNTLSRTHTQKIKVNRSQGHCAQYATLADGAANSVRPSSSSKTNTQHHFRPIAFTARANFSAFASDKGWQVKVGLPIASQSWPWDERGRIGLDNQTISFRETIIRTSLDPVCCRRKLPQRILGSLLFGERSWRCSSQACRPSRYTWVFWEGRSQTCGGCGSGFRCPVCHVSAQEEHGGRTGGWTRTGGPYTTYQHPGRKERGNREKESELADCIIYMHVKQALVTSQAETTQIQSPSKKQCKKKKKKRTKYYTRSHIGCLPHAQVQC